MGQEKVADLRVFQETCNMLNRNTQLVQDKCNQSLSEANHVLNDTQEELANSNRLLLQAIEDENRKLFEMREREVEVAEASSGLPETAAWFADATRRLAIAIAEYEKAVAHRILMEQRVELANQCVMIATEMVETLISKYNYSQNQIVQYSETGISRLNAADKATGGYVDEIIRQDGKKENHRRTDAELSNDQTGMDTEAKDYDYASNVLLSDALLRAPAKEGVYILFLDGKVMKCGRAAYSQGIKWRFTQYYNLNYDDRARDGDLWSVSNDNRDRITVSWQACPVSKCKELEAKLFRKYGKGPWGLRAPSTCFDDTWELLI